MTSDDRKRRFAAAFPWWEDGKARHGWHAEVSTEPGVDEVRAGGADSMWSGPLIAVRHNPEKDSGKIRLHMPGATREQIAAVEEWLAAEYRPAKKLPGAGSTG